MKAADRYLMFVRWSEEDDAYVGYCPDLFPAGGVCHGATATDAYAKLSEIAEDTVMAAAAQNLDLPPVRTRPMREVEVMT